MTIARTAFAIFLLPFIMSSFSGCSETPTPFSKGQEIPMGAAKLKVSNYSTGTIGSYIPDHIPPTQSNENFSKLLGSAKRDSPAFVVFFSHSNDGNKGGLLSLMTLNDKMFYLLDKNGEKIYPLAVLPKRILFMGEGWIMDLNDVSEAMNDLEKTKDFFAIFGFEKGPSNFTLFIKNPSPQKGQPGLASVSLR